MAGSGTQGLALRVGCGGGGQEGGKYKGGRFLLTVGLRRKEVGSESRL
jgi:hypothetical protein